MGEKVSKIQNVKESMSYSLKRGLSLKGEGKDLFWIAYHISCNVFLIGRIQFTLFWQWHINLWTV